MLTRITLLLGPLSYLLLLSHCSANYAHDGQGDDNDAGCELRPELYRQDCSASAQCGDVMSCIRLCKSCETRCQVDCNTTADCEAVGAGTCTNYEIEGQEFGYCTEAASICPAVQANTGAYAGGSVPPKPMDGDPCEFATNDCDCPISLCSPDVCGTCCEDTMHQGVYCDGACRSSCSSTSATSSTDSGPGGAAGVPGSSASSSGSTAGPSGTGVSSSTSGSTGGGGFGGPAGATGTSSSTSDGGGGRGSAGPGGTTGAAGASSD